MKIRNGEKLINLKTQKHKISKIINPKITSNLYLFLKINPDNIDIPASIYEGRLLYKLLQLNDIY